MIEVIRSPARVSWHVKCNGVTIATPSTRVEANQIAKGLAAKYKLSLKGVRGV